MLKYFLKRHWLGTAFALFFGAVSLLFLSDAHRIKVKCDNAEKTEIVSLQNPFASAKSFQARFSTKYTFTCKEMVVIEYSPASKSIEECLELLDGLEASLKISDANGKTVIENELDKDFYLPVWQKPDYKTCHPAMLMFHPLPIGDYEFAIEVKTPAAKLANIPHRLVMRYELCGIEKLAGTFGNLIGFCAAVICLIISACMASMEIKAKRKKKLTERSSV